jgi:hypothetical protein
MTTQAGKGSGKTRPARDGNTLNRQVAGAIVRRCTKRPACQAEIKGVNRSTHPSQRSMSLSIRMCLKGAHLAVTGKVCLQLARPSRCSANFHQECTEAAKRPRTPEGRR